MSTRALVSTASLCVGLPSGKSGVIIGESVSNSGNENAENLWIQLADGARVNVPTGDAEPVLDVARQLEVYSRAAQHYPLGNVVTKRCIDCLLGDELTQVEALHHLANICLKASGENRFQSSQFVVERSGSRGVAEGGKVRELGSFKMESKRVDDEETGGAAVFQRQVYGKLASPAAEVEAVDARPQLSAFAKSSGKVTAFREGHDIALLFILEYLLPYRGLSEGEVYKAAAAGEFKHLANEYKLHRIDEWRKASAQKRRPDGPVWYPDAGYRNAHKIETRDGPSSTQLWDTVSFQQRKKPLRDTHFYSDLRAALLAIPGMYAIPMWLRFVHQASIAELARIFRVSQPAMRQRLSRGCAMLAPAMTAYLPRHK